MARSHVLRGGTAPVHPEVRRIGTDDLRAAVKAGLADFKANPTHLLFLGLIYPLVGVMAARLAFGLDILPLLYPMVSGLALLGPFIAIGLYELSRRRELGEDPGWMAALEVRRNVAIGSILALGLVLLVLFIAWLMVAATIYQGILGDPPGTIADFVREVFTTPEGWTLIVVGNAVGFVFAAVAFSISVVSFPLLVDRNVGAAEAIRTSLAAVRANPVPMALWGFGVGLTLAVAALPLFVGLAVAVPVLGHATWHLYRRVVAPV